MCIKHHTGKARFRYKITFHDDNGGPKKDKNDFHKKYRRTQVNRQEPFKRKLKIPLKNYRKTQSNRQKK